MYPVPYFWGKKSGNYGVIIEQGPKSTEEAVYGEGGGRVSEIAGRFEACAL
jgi:hypothetical protein